MLQNVTGGVVQIRTDPVIQRESMYCQILEAMDFGDIPPTVPKCFETLQKVLLRSGQCLGRKPILVFEVYATTISDVSDIYKPIRAITYDEKLATTALVLSDALAAFSLKSSDRWDLTFVDEFTDAEANEYLDNSKCLVGNATARAILLDATMRGMDLHSFAQSKKSVEEFTRELILFARITISNLVNVKNREVPELGGPAFEKLVCMLLEDKYKDGVSPEMTEKFAYCIA